MRLFQGSGGVSFAGSGAAGAEAIYAEAMASYLHGDFATAYRGFRKALKQGVRSVSAEFYAGMAAFQLGRVPDAIPHLERVVEAGEELPDALMRRYAPADVVRQHVQIAIVEGVYATHEVDSLAAVLLLVEAYQGDGKREKAIALMRELLAADPSSEAARLSLCDLLYEAADFHGVIDVGLEASPVPSFGFACHVFAAQAYGWLDDWQSSRETMERALSHTEADDEKALQAAQDVLDLAYSNLGLSPKRIATFQRALRRKRKSPRPEDAPGVAVYKSRAYRPDDSTP